MNNVVFYVEHGDAQKHVLRVYNNGENTARVQYEHAVLAELRKVAHTLSFAIPRTLPALDGGASFVKLSNGADAAMFELIPGTLPKLGFVREMGKAAGELSKAMGSISVPMESPTAPYWDIFRVHHAADRDAFYATVAGPAFDGVREATDFLVAQLRLMESSIEAFHAMKLPTSLIHGDCHVDNCLVRVGANRRGHARTVLAFAHILMDALFTSQVDNGAVSGVLDFEFAAKDFRGIELASASVALVVHTLA